MTSITLVRADETRALPGFDVELIKHLFCMHAPVVRQWITEQRAEGGIVLVADEAWVNPSGGIQSLTIPIEGRDAEALATSRCTLTAAVGEDRFPCRSHNGGKHHFAAYWPACPAPFCRLEPGHRDLHDIPSGKAEIHQAVGQEAAGTGTADA